MSSANTARMLCAAIIPLIMGLRASPANDPVDRSPNPVPRAVYGITLLAAVSVTKALRKAGAEATIKWPNDVYLNGKKLGRIEGAFMRGRFDVTDIVRAGEKNALAVRVEKNETPGSVKQKTFESTGKNGGALGLDNPTFHACIGWDWIPTIRGRNSGIWNRVYLTQSGTVKIENPFVSTMLPLPDTSRAEVSIEADLVNHDAKPVKGTLRASFGELKLEQKVTVAGASTEHIKLDPSTHAALKLENPKLWWPVGYGEPNLYDVELIFEGPHKEVSDKKTFKAGVRQFTASGVPRPVLSIPPTLRTLVYWHRGKPTLRTIP